MPGELRDLAGARLLVEPLRVARLAGLEGGRDVHLDEVARPRRSPARRRGPRGTGEMKEVSTITPRVGEQLRDLGDAADVLGAVLGREAEVLVQAVADVVAVEHVGELAPLDERLLRGHRDRRLPGAREAREPERGAALAEQLLAVLARRPGPACQVMLVLFDSATPYSPGRLEAGRLAARPGGGEATRSRSEPLGGGRRSASAARGRRRARSSRGRGRCGSPRARVPPGGRGRAAPGSARGAPRRRPSPSRARAPGQPATRASPGTPSIERFRLPGSRRAGSPFTSTPSSRSPQRARGAARGAPRAAPPRPRAPRRRCAARRRSRRSAAPGASPSAGPTRGRRRGAAARGGAAGRARRT